MKIIQDFLIRLFTCFGGNVKVELDLTNYATKYDIKKTIGVDTSAFAKKIIWLA